MKSQDPSPGTPKNQPSGERPKDGNLTSGEQEVQQLPQPPAAQIPGWGGLWQRTW